MKLVYGKVAYESLLGVNYVSGVLDVRPFCARVSRLSVFRPEWT